jgi:hypothetical protein
MCEQNEQNVHKEQVSIPRQSRGLYIGAPGMARSA